MNAPLSLPLLKDSGVINVLSACDQKFGSPISEPVSPNSPELKPRYSDGWTTADRREINSSPLDSEKNDKVHVHYEKNMKDCCLESKNQLIRDSSEESCDQFYMRGGQVYLDHACYMKL